MTLDATRQHIERAVNDLRDLVWETQSSAIASADTRCRGLKHNDYSYLRPIMTRTVFRDELGNVAMPKGWTLGGEPRRMAQTLITGHGVCLRYLKERRSTYPGGVPAAGHTAARKTYWEQPLFTQFKEGEWAQPEEPVRTTNLLLLWDYLSPADADSAFTMRIVRPTGAGQYGRCTPFDISVDLAPSLGLEHGLRFRGDADDTDFYADIDDLEQKDGS
ncbi:hypothetical protein E4J66_06260 [Actinomyces viscosus]|uniref:Uncharacterized protein n=2 Tax=Actinomyces viscosus TaxID=1656 RepID=A0A448PP91_ACTVI|nr:hypothetical protein [Actinomyces viscosus]TFH52812.1 hypothetical protein E4J66_06260 [Actinomyces viscosus]VEI18441.1 Uncharacterised protein [Actinomyces viscosus]